MITAEAPAVPPVAELAEVKPTTFDFFWPQLARRGFYDGSVNGLYGPKTHAAIRDFEHAAGLKPSIRPNEALLQAILRFPAKADKSSR